MLLPDQSGLVEGIQQAGNALTQALQQAGMRRQQQQYGTILQDELSKLSENPTPLEFQQVLSNAIKKGIPIETATQFVNQYANLQRGQPKGMLQGKTTDELAGVFKKLGMDESAAQSNAELYNSLTTGGQTKFGEMLIDQIQRGNVKGFKETNEMGIAENAPMESNITKAKNEMNDIKTASKLLVNPDAGLKPVERVKREDQRYKINLKPYQEWQDKIRSLAAEDRRLDVMGQLNETDKLPKKIGLLNVDSMGNLRFPFLSSKEAQKYQKLLNEFVQNARDSFGARVTNFELDVFLKRLPTLWNSKEGRTAVLQQMKIVNEINNLYEKGKIEAVKEARGIRKIDLDKAEEYATTRYGRRINELENEYRKLESSIGSIKTEENIKRRPLNEILG